MDEVDKLSVLEDSLFKAMIKKYGVAELNTDAFEKKFIELFELVREDCEQDSLTGYKEKASKLLADIRAENSGFEARSFNRWKPSFDHLEMMWAIAQELGEMHGISIKGSDAGRGRILR
jgi:hypothetical protein